MTFTLEQLGILVGITAALGAAGATALRALWTVPVDFELEDELDRQAAREIVKRGRGQHHRGRLQVIVDRLDPIARHYVDQVQRQRPNPFDS